MNKTKNYDKEECNLFERIEITIEDRNYLLTLTISSVYLILEIKNKDVIVDCYKCNLKFEDLKNMRYFSNFNSLEEMLTSVKEKVNDNLIKYERTDDKLLMKITYELDRKNCFVELELTQVFNGECNEALIEINKLFLNLQKQSSLVRSSVSNLSILDISNLKSVKSFEESIFYTKVFSEIIELDNKIQFIHNFINKNIKESESEENKNEDTNPNPNLSIAKNSSSEFYIGDEDLLLTLSIYSSEEKIITIQESNDKVILANNDTTKKVEVLNSNNLVDKANHFKVNKQPISLVENDESKFN